MTKKCIFEGCKTIPIYNKIGKTKPIYCNKHKLSDMINVKYKTCIFVGCNIIPNYNNIG